MGAAVAAAPGQRTKELEGPFLLRAGHGGEEPKPRHPWESRSPPLPQQVSQALPLLSCKIMLFLILYLPRMPVIFFLSESNFLLTFLPNVAKHDLCERTVLAACSLPWAPQEPLLTAQLLVPRRRAGVPTPWGGSCPGLLSLLAARFPGSAEPGSRCHPHGEPCSAPALGFAAGRRCGGAGG